MHKRESLLVQIRLDRLATRIRRSARWFLLLLAIAGALPACSLDDVATNSSGSPTPTSALPARTATVTRARETEISPTVSPTVASLVVASPTTSGPAHPTATTAIEPSSLQPDESADPVLKIPLAGPLASRRAELSGLAWYGDHLIILPQFPDFATSERGGFLYALHVTDVVAFLDGRSDQPLEPIPVPFQAPGLEASIAGFEGYEAIAFSGDDAYLTVEARDGDDMLGYLFKGAMAPDLSTLTIDTSRPAVIAPQTNALNISEESLFVADQIVGAIHELNGQGINAAPVVHLFDRDLAPLGTIGFPNVPFRITDASGLDSDGRFWAINYFYPGSNELHEVLEPQDGDDNDDRTWPPWEGLGRLLEFHFSPSGVTLTDAAPVQLGSLLSDLHNWEGLVRLGNRGFLLVSDEFPGTVLGFVPSPNAE